MNPLKGVWELIEGEYNVNDTVIFFPREYPEAKSFKHFSDKYWFTIGNTNESNGESWSFAGTYEINEGEYTQVQLVNISGKLSEPLTMKFSVTGDTLRQESGWHKEVWIRLE